MRKLRTEQKDRQQENSRPRDERNGGGADIAGTCDKADAAGEKGKTNEVDSEELKKAAEKACVPGSTIHNMPIAVMPEMVYQGLLEADRLGAARRGLS